ncbi:amino acid ABC transporter permease [Amycolatopsis sp. CA-230715]|uniref:amino acid ABC transporter permease n=1 Tax=Amycolatopsis sp. CA-230715 TaxID=2745196 RepID=UPI001C01439F|nr:amino acid ABC transporter permease [Amycolatopsis sp. CA-230715]QWF78599.1 putative glutamine ABC transporter permease protein GlnM [Amycolatopsis sp. CA-230715]
MRPFSEYLGDFANGLLVTIELTASSFLVAALIAVVLVAFRVSPIRPLRLFGTAYVHLFQNIPLLVWLVFLVFGLPEIGVKFDLFTTGVLGTGLYSASYYAETLRSGVNSVPLGQVEAARALGMSVAGSFGSIILPQALRSVVQPLGNVTIGLLMNTALTGAGAGLVDLTEVANRVNLEVTQPVVIFVGVGVMYGLLALGISTTSGALARKLVIHR